MTTATTSSNSPVLREALEHRTPDAALDLPEGTRLTVAHVSELLNMPADTVRYYEREGLVEVPRSPSGHRAYGTDQIRRLEFLRRMRMSGMSMARLTRYIALVEQGEDTVPERLAVMQEHRGTVLARIHELEVALAATDYKIRVYGGHLDGTCTDSTIPDTTTPGGTR